MKRNIWLLIIIIFATAFMLTIYWLVISPNHTSVWNGREVALKYGCFNCHGFEGQGNIENPGYRYRQIPSWQGEQQ